MQLPDPRLNLSTPATRATLLFLLLITVSLAENPLPNVERLRSSPLLGQLKPNPMPSAPKTAAQETLARMYLPEGFRAVLVAAEPDVQQPVAFTFDERGRIWVAEAYSYPQKRAEGKGLDKIIILEDRDGDGRFETRKVFAEGLNLVSGLEVGYGGVWVGAAPELLFIPDRNHDDVPDGPPQVLLDGFGYQDTHECLNSFLWGPDGWLYGNQGVFNTAHIGKPGTPDAERTELRAGVWRYHPVKHKFEVFAYGGSNQWGLDYDEHGQIFMSHCRSYWGRGPVTHVIQGGHYWNQANANHAPFIIADPPGDFPGFRNYLLASARHGHGAGGAGKPGSDAIFGGHSHVGTMIYLGDNWPVEYRGHLFTHNLGGHQINQELNNRLGSGFDTVHASRDVFFCSDPKYVAVDLQYGPDGAVYVIDWYDQQHCHNPNTESWDRSNGRIYRIEYVPAYKPAKVDLTNLSDLQLAELLTHKNEWYVRTARRLLAERTLSKQGAAPPARDKVLELAQDDHNPIHRLDGLLAAHSMSLLSEDVMKHTLSDTDEYIRAWTIQLALEDREVSPELLRDFVHLAKSDPFPVVRLYLASAIQRAPDETAWQLIEALTQHGEDRDDQNLPYLLWDGLAPRMENNTARAFLLAQETRVPQLGDWIYWYAATFEGDALNRAVVQLEKLRGEPLRRRLAGLWLAMKPRANVSKPASWQKIAHGLYSSSDFRVQRQAEQLAAVFGDVSMFPRLREALADTSRDADLRKHAYAVLSRAQDRASLPVFLLLLDDNMFRSAVISLFARFDSPDVSTALIQRFETFPASDRSAALSTLTSRTSFARAMLDAIASGKLKRDQLTAFHVRQLSELRDPEVDKLVAATWGRIKQSTGEKQAQIARLEKTFVEAPLWAYSANAGREHFQKLCAQCHRIGNEGNRVGPELTGAGKNGIRYFLENIIDPNAVIGADYQATTVETKNGDLISGLIVNETSSAFTFRTTAGESVVPKTEIVRRDKSELSLMPEGLLDGLNDREQIELFKFLTSS